MSMDEVVAKLQREHRERCESHQAASARPAPEPQGQCERSRVATCSLPVSSAGLENENSALRAIIGDLLEAHETVYKHERWACVEQAAARAYAKLEEMDRNAARANVRQPEENQ